jgi:flagellar biosynthetic protein FlhB
MSDQQDRTEAPTAKRLQKARADGQAPVSREATALAVLGAVALVLTMAAPGIAQALVQRLAVFLSQADRLEPGAALRAAAAAMAVAAAPLVMAALVAGATAVLLQSGFLVQLHSAAPDFARLNPTRGLKRIFGVSALIESAKSVAKIAVVSWAGWHAIGAALPELRQAMGWDAATLADRAAAQMVGILLAMLAAQAVIATLDVLYVRLRHVRGLRMSRQELLDEHKEMEGDPQIRRRIRQIRLQRARRRMLKAVPKATVVVTNPTHYAVALAYDRGKGGAPRVVAKGVDSMAARIRELAQDNRVPLVANPPLARALHRVELDAEIPAEHYKAVAEIIAYVWRLRGMAVGAAVK